MGAPKQKWTAEEEAALKAGIDKHGTGKWRTILKDPEFSHILYLRSNVDLKDKWRNMGVTTNGLGSHERAKVSRKRSAPAYKHDDDDFSPSPVEEDFDDEPLDSRPVSCSYKKMQITGPKKSNLRLENLVVEAITNLNEPAGSSMMTIAMYIEDHYWSPQDFESMLSMKLKIMTTSGMLVKVKHNYRIAPPLGFSEQRGSMMLASERKQKVFSSVERGDFSTPVRSQIDTEIARMRSMTSLEAAAAAARAMAEAEVAMAEAEEAAREAEIAEADAEEAQAYAEAALLSLKNRSTDGSSFQEIRGQ